MVPQPLNAIFAPLLGASAFSRYAAGALVLMPLGLLMGIPFPSGLRQVAAGDDGRVAWAWALNGYSSVVATASIGIGKLAVVEGTGTPTLVRSVLEMLDELGVSEENIHYDDFSS